MDSPLLAHQAVSMTSISDAVLAALMLHLKFGGALLLLVQQPERKCPHEYDVGSSLLPCSTAE